MAITVFYSPSYFLSVEHSAFYIGLLSTYFELKAIYHDSYLYTIHDSYMMLEFLGHQTITMVFRHILKLWYNKLIFGVKHRFLFKHKGAKVGKEKRDIDTVLYYVLSARGMWTLDGQLNERAQVLGCTGWSA